MSCDYDPADFAETRRCPDCDDELTEESSCIGGRLVCIDCWEKQFATVAREAVRRAS